MKVLLKVNRDITENLLDRLRGNNIIIDYILTVQPIIIADMDDPDILNFIDFIDYYELDELFETQSVNIVPNIRVNKVKATGYAGANCPVGIIDTGMNDVRGLEIHKSEIFSTSAVTTDALFRGKPHGSHVGQLIKYIAPWCKIYNLKVASDNGEITKSAVLKALDWAYSNNINIVNISLGKKSVCNEKCMVCNTVNAMVDQGFTVIAAIGNFGMDGEGITGCPANAEKSLAVGAVDANKTLAEYSSVAMPGMNKPDVLAPGFANLYGEPFNGTSCAAPFVTGVIVALSAKFPPETVVKVIKDTAVGINLPSHKQGCGLIHIENMLGVLKNEKSVNQG